MGREVLNTLASTTSCRQKQTDQRGRASVEPESDKRRDARGRALVKETRGERAARSNWPRMRIRRVSGLFRMYLPDTPRSAFDTAKERAGDEDGMERGDGTWAGLHWIEVHGIIAWSGQIGKQ
eukprot:2184801-Rhodomonas_salina.2